MTKLTRSVSSLPAFIVVLSCLLGDATAQTPRTAAPNERVEIALPKRGGEVLVTVNGEFTQLVSQKPGSVTIDLAVADPTVATAEVLVSLNGKEVAREVFGLLPVVLASSELAVSLRNIREEDLAASLAETGFSLVPGSFVSTENTEAAVALLDTAGLATREALKRIWELAEDMVAPGDRNLTAGPNYRYGVAMMTDPELLDPASRFGYSRRPSWTSPGCDSASVLSTYAEDRYELLSGEQGQGLHLLEAINVDQAHRAGLLGGGVSIPVIDTGFGTFDVFDCAGFGGTLGHGTFVVQLAKMVAPRAATQSRIACDENGLCDTYAITERLLQLESELLVTGQKTVANLSLSGASDPESGIDLVLYNTLAELSGRYPDNFLVVAAAGNNGLDADPVFASTPLYPAAFSEALAIERGVDPLPNIVSVGTVGWDATSLIPAAAGFNPQGVEVDVLAPGVRLCLETSGCEPGSGSELTGSSYASAVVSGAAALLWEQCPELGAAELRDLLRRKVRPVNDSSFGLIDGDPIVTCDGSRVTELGWRLYGDARLDENKIALTEASNLQLGATWLEEPLDLTRNFSLSFKMYLGDKDFGSSGILFTLLPAPPLSLPNNDLWWGFPNFCSDTKGACFGVEIDTYANTQIGDPDEDHAALVAGGVVSHDGSLPVATLPNIEDGLEHSLQLDWDATGKTLMVTVDGKTVISHNIDLVADIFDGVSEVTFGFTAQTGGASELHYNSHYVYPISGNVAGIVYHANQDGRSDYDVFLIDEAGSEKLRLIDTPGFARLAVWDSKMGRLLFSEGIQEDEIRHQILKPDLVRGGFFPDPQLSDPVAVGGVFSGWFADTDSILRYRKHDDYTGAGTFIVQNLVDGSELLLLDPAWADDAVSNPVAIDFTPDGSKVVWQSSAPSSAIDNDIWLAQLDDDGRVERASITNLTANNVLDSFPRISPDGTQVAFLRSFSPQGNSQPVNIMLVKIDGTRFPGGGVEKQLTTYSESSQVSAETLAWSPDGEMLVFSHSDDNGQNFDLWVVGVDDGSLRRLTDTARVNEFPLDWR
ncbi:MAG: S8 family serine peptidase [Trueperaceae bacterium]|nr:MAG: S8 family serine peptidase [Trueperaceae bacterium]